MCIVMTLVIYDHVSRFYKMATFGCSEDVVAEVCRILNCVECPTTMDWKNLASQFNIPPESMISLDKEDNPARTLLKLLEKKGVTRDKMIDVCRKKGFVSVARAMERDPVAIAKDTCTSEKEPWIPALERKLVEVPYEWLKRATNGFGDKSFGCKGGFKLGKGGFGEVFYVKIGIEGKGKFECAVKKIMSDVVTDDFEKEVDVMKKFHHPHIMPLFGISKDGEFPCIIYHYMREGSLATVLQRKAVMSPHQRLSIIRDIASALEYLHTKGKTPLIHRDVKSDNILLDEKFVAKLSDFGITRFLSSSDKSRTQTQCAIGTSLYMSPEAMRGVVSIHGDVFALGIVLVEVLVNRCTSANFDVQTLLESSPEELNKKILTSDIGWKASTIPDLMGLVSKCTNRVSSNRPSAKEMKLALETFLKDSCQS